MQPQLTPEWKLTWAQSHPGKWLPSSCLTVSVSSNQWLLLSQATEIQCNLLHELIQQIKVWVQDRERKVSNWAPTTIPQTTSPQGLTYIISFNPHNTSMRQISAPFYRSENQGTNYARLQNLPSPTARECRARVWTVTCLLQKVPEFSHNVLPPWK